MPRRNLPRYARFTNLALALGLLSVVLNGCSSGERGAQTGDGEKKYTIAVIPKGTTHEFWKAVHAGAQQAADELGNVEIIWQGPLNESNTEGQIRIYEDLVTKRVDGICLAPNDSQALVRSVRNAKSEGIPTVIFDSGLADEESIVSYVATDNYKCGQLAARHLSGLLNGEGQVILLRYRIGSESTEQREQGFLDALKAESPGIEVLVSDQYSGTTPQEALDRSQYLLQQYHDQVDGVFTVCEPNSTGMLGAIEEQADLAGKVKFIAFDPQERLIQAMADNKIHGIVLQDPVQMGKLAVKNLVAHLEGQEVERRISTGEHIATPENMNEPEMNALLHPKQFGAEEEQAASTTSAGE